MSVPPSFRIYNTRKNKRSTTIKQLLWKLYGNEILGESQGDTSGYSVSLSANG